MNEYRAGETVLVEHVSSAPKGETVSQVIAQELSEEESIAIEMEIVARKLVEAREFLEWLTGPGTFIVARYEQIDYAGNQALQKCSELDAFIDYAAHVSLGHEWEMRHLEIPRKFTQLAMDEAITQALELGTQKRMDDKMPTDLDRMPF